MGKLAKAILHTFVFVSLQFKPLLEDRRPQVALCCSKKIMTKFKLNFRSLTDGWQQSN